VIVGGYTLDLYCDVEGCRAPGGAGMPEQAAFFAETGSQCRQYARNNGWVLDLKAGTCRCPKCARDRKGKQVNRG